MNKKISIFLHNLCTYTQEGIKHLQPELHCDSGCNITIKPFGVDTHTVLNNNDENIFILGLHGYSNSHVGSLEFIMNWLPICHHEVRVIIIAKTNSIGNLKNYLLGLKNVYAVLDHATALHEFRIHLQNAIMDSPGSSPRKPTISPLTNQELNVLKYLLKGMPVTMVADKLCIHYKTVSSHKRSALNKLGVNSLHRLMKCGNDTSIMNELLRNKI